MSEPYSYKFFSRDLRSEELSQKLKNVVAEYASVVRCDVNLEKQIFRVLSTEVLDVDQFCQYVAQKILLPQQMRVEIYAPKESTAEKMSVHVDGMSCRSCEILIERAWKKLPGVTRVKVNAGTGAAELTIAGAPAPTIDGLQSALGNEKYRISSGGAATVFLPVERPSVGKLIGLFAVVLVTVALFSKLGIIKTGITIGPGTGFWAVFVIGLIAASSSCIAVSGGLLLSTAARFNERYGSRTRSARMRPVFLFVFGRIVSYAMLGGLIGYVGTALAPSPVFTGFVAIAAAFFMVVMGLDMLHIAPSWMKGLLPRVPKGLSHKILDAEGKEHPLMPFLLGAATFFLPCGFTQALQLYALTTGSFATGASLLFAFALGTAPAMLALGWASSSVKGKVGQWFFQFSGALVVILGLWNIQNGLNILGMTFPFSEASTPAVAATVGTSAGVTVEGSTQIMKMAVDETGYSPNNFVIKAGVPTRWEVDGTHAAGCISVLVSRAFGVQKLLQPGINTLEFTPESKGTFPFSCSMGMYRGTITVI